MKPECDVCKKILVVEDFDLDDEDLKILCGDCFDRTLEKIAEPDEPPNAA